MSAHNCFDGSYVFDSRKRSRKDNQWIYRRRRCRMCNRAFTTVEFEASESKLEAMVNMFKDATE